MVLGPRCSGSSSASPDSKWRGEFDPVRLNDSIYELYKPKGIPTMQIVFFHGIYSRDSMDAHFSTWENEEGTLLWPQKWLSKDFPDARILTASYNGDVGKSSCESFDMHNIVENLMTNIMEEDVGQISLCPVVLVGHCVGGLVMKKLCLEARNSSGCEKHKNFLNNLRGLFFYATPHQGIVSSSKNGEMRQSALSDYLPTLNKEAARLNHDFDNLRSSYASWRIYALGEGRPTKSVYAVYDKISRFALESVRIVLPNQEILFLTYEGRSLFPKDEKAVPEASSRVGQRFYTVDADHITISKPKSEIDSRYSAVKSMLVDIVGKPEEELQSPGRKVASDELNKQEDGDAAQLLKYLSDFLHPVTQEIAAEELLSLCENKQDHSIKLVQKDGAVNILLKCLSNDGRPPLQEKVAWIFERLSKVSSFVLRVTKEGIANEVIVELVKELVKCLSKDQHPSLQEAAAWTLCHLLAIVGHGLEVVYAKEDVAKIVKDCKAIELLVKCLKEQEREQKGTSLRDAAAYTLGNLAKLGDQYIVAAKEVMVIDGLKECLRAHNKPGLRKATNYALGKLGQETNREWTSADPVKSLSKHAGPVAQDSALEILCSKAEKGDDSIVEEDGAIAGLVKWLLSKDPLLQRRAVLALYNLTKRKNKSIRLTVAKEEGAILGLVRCLSEHADPYVQERAAWTLCYLFDKEQNDTIRSSIVKEDRAIVELVRWLSDSTNRGLQEAAAWILCHLTEIDDDHDHSVKLRIVKEGGATTGLVKCLSRNNRTDLRRAAAYTFGKLAKLGDQYIRVAKEAGAIVALEECSSAHEDPELQKAAGRALCKMKTTT